MNRTNSTDRLSFTLVISVIVHLVILLGVSFNVFTPPTNTALNNLEITLVKQKEKTAPEQADFLAQANNEGGGEFDTVTPTPSEDLPTPIIAEEAASPEPLPTPSMEKALDTADPVDMIQEPTPAPVKEPEPTPIPEVVEKTPTPAPPKPVEKPKEKVKVLTQAESERKIEKTKSAEEAVEESVEAPPKPTAKELMMRARQQLQQLEKELDQTTKSLSKRPKKKKLTSSTKEYAAAAYMKAWELKIERIGNMNYPQEAKRMGLSGSLMLSVDINPDGSVPPGGIVVSKSSGHKLLDDAAIKIVRLGAPYAAIPKDVLKSNDMLTIIRTWKFETQGLSTR